MPSAAKHKHRRRRVLPGFGLSLGYTVTYLSLIVLLPLCALFVRSATMGWSEFRRVVLSESVLSAYRLTIGASALAAAFNVLIGLLLAWVLARYRFPGRRVMDAVIDLPFALPTAVAGIALTYIYSERGWVGGLLRNTGFSYPWPSRRGFAQGSAWPVEWDWYEKVTRAPLGVVLALMFVGLPFVVRTVQPVLEDMSHEPEEASVSLGATRWQTFWRVILPQVFPALIAGFALAFARGLGEYGSVIFVAGKRPETTITSHKIIELIELDETYAAPTAVAVVLLVISFALLLGINMLQRAAASRGDA